MSQVTLETAAAANPDMFDPSNIASLNVASPEIAVPRSAGSMYHVADQVGARSLWARGITGSGVTVALIDTGVARIGELEGVVAAVDFSVEQIDPSRQLVDSYGHGTHLAGIIAGCTPGANPATASEHPEWFVGIAPDADLVSVKVSGRDGQVSPEVLIGAVDWVTNNAADLNIGVLALAVDVPATTSYENCPLAAAIERAWHAGIVVVTAAGNNGAAGRLSAPAYHPTVIAVGALDFTEGRVAAADWSTTGDGVRNPDLAAPGAHIESLRAPGSLAADEHPEALLADGRFLGSGSSQAAAVVAGVAALLRQAHPSATPDEIKRMLVGGSAPLHADAAAVGAGLVDAVAALTVSTRNSTQRFAPAVGVESQPVIGVMARCTPSEWSGVSWSGVSWSGVSWSGVSWSGVSWSGVSWSGVSWSGVSWSGVSWSGVSWSGVSWSGVSWSGVSWSGVSWSGVT
ncbi:MAG TPA: S8 family serine peptidase, partial [Ilumatobacter sp.]|nr:S8 family serine peptidase [Ilumatobacter sp.]